MDTNNLNNTTSTYDQHQSYCMNRLPCGYCRVLEKPCPMLQGTINPYGGPVITYSTNTTDKKNND